MSARRRGLPALLSVALLLGAGAGPASAAAGPDSRARSLLSQVRSLQAQSDAALSRYDGALTAMSTAVTAGIEAEANAQGQARAARITEAALDGRVRAMYISGGRAAMLSALLSAHGLADLTSRVSTMSQLVVSGQERSAASTVAARQATSEAGAAHRRALASVGTAGDVQTAATRLRALLDEQRRLLAVAEAQAREARATEATAAALRSAQAAAARVLAAAARVTAAATRRIAPLPGSPAYFALYRAAAATCPGLSWTVLAAVGQVESGHGRNPGTSSAGAQGPMQFLPGTFAAYAIDGDGDGRTLITSPADAIFTAAHFLCVHGAGSGPAGVARALLFYNHAQWYVDLVVALAARYGAGG